MVRKALLALLPAVVAVALAPTAATAARVSQGTSPIAAATACVGGMAGSYPCKNIDLQSNLPLASMGGGSGSGGWGWTDSSTGKEYAIVARTTGTSFVDISSPTSPVYLGNLPSATGTSGWRELNVHNNTAYIVSDGNGSHGLQVFDLTRLRGVTAPQTWSADYRDTSFTNAHTITINYDSGYAYVNGSNTCSGGSRMFNLANRLAPVFAGCVSGDGYTHDAQAVIYHGPDTRYTGKEILVSSNADTITVWDVTTKSAPVQLSRTGYSGVGYTHQGAFTEDHRYFLLDDETDESNFGHPTWTRVFDYSSLTAPVQLATFVGPTNATDHNQFVKGGYSYQSNYKAGLRIINLANVANPANMTEDAFFDVYPSANTAGYNGTWTNYPYYPSGNVAVFTIEGGLFVVKPNLAPPPADDFTISASPSAGSVNPGGSLTTTVSTALSNGSPQAIVLSASGLPAGATASFSPASVNTGGSSTLTITTSTSTPAGTYPVTITGTGSSATHTTTYSLTVNGPAGCSGTNIADVSIPDNTTVSSPITISGCPGNASATATVEVHIVHTYVGDLVVSLVAPDGSVYVLQSRAGGSADNIDTTYTVNLSSEVANGTWNLRVQDAATADTGYINSWTLNLGGGTAPGCSGSNGNDVTIPDNTTVNSPLTISGCTGNASATSTVEVHIVHTFSGDLVVSLVAPDGTVYLLRNRTGGSADNIDQTFTVDVSSEARNGTWNLRVQDAATTDTGYINTWTLTL